MTTARCHESNRKSCDHVTVLACRSLIEKQTDDRIGIDDGLGEGIDPISRFTSGAQTDVARLITMDFR